MKFNTLEEKSKDQLKDNIKIYGFRDLPNRELRHLIIILQQELGKFIITVFANEFQVNNQVYNDLYDLMAVIYNIHIILEYRRYGYVDYSTIGEFYRNEILNNGVK